ncbi:autotransporter outer membrane beta-barrel domain-containing protein, partial [Cupriavidus sp. 2MCAB6]
TGSSGAGGIGIVGSSLDLILGSGATVAGGLSGDGARRADAIHLTGPNNRVELQAGATVTGNVVAGGIAGNVFALGGSGNGGFDVSSIGASAQFRGFTAFEKLGTSIWTLTGSGNQSWSIQAGTLRAGASGVFGASSQITVASAATLDLGGFNQSIDTLAGAGMVTLGAGTLNAGSGNGGSTFDGVISGTGGLIKAGTGTLTLSDANT